MTMRNSLFSFFVIGIAALCALVSPHDARAALITFNVVPNTVSGDTATIVEVRVDPQSQNLNVVQGSVDFGGIAGDQLSVEADTAKSLLSLWPTSPHYSPDTASVSFTGGIPGGFNHEGLLFRLRIKPAVAGTVQMSLTNGAVYLNNGQGTEENVTAQPIAIAVNRQSPGIVVPLPTTNATSQTSPQSAHEQNDILILLSAVGVLCLVSVALWFRYKKYVKK